MTVRRKICAYILFIFMFSLFPFQALGTGAAFAEGDVVPWDGTTSKPDTDDDGVYLISTGAELAWIAEMVNDPETNEEYGAASYRQTADIDLGGEEWTPIGTIEEGVAYPTFFGSYDGGGYTISGLSMSGEDVTFAGLFGVVLDLRVTANNRAAAMGGAITNVHLRDVAIDFESGNALSIGALVGRNETGEIENCSATGTVKGVSSSIYKNYVGGLVGYSRLGRENTITNVYTDVEVRASGAGDVYAGGVVGTSETALKSCFAAGDVYAESSSTTGDGEAAYAGGLVGYTTDAVELCFAKGDVHVETTEEDVPAYAGGLIGMADTAETIFGSAAMGDVYAATTAADAPVYAGGFVGQNADPLEEEGGLITACFATGNVFAETGTEYSGIDAGGFAGFNERSVENCFAVGNVYAENVDDGLQMNIKAGGFAGSNYTDIAASYSYGEVEVNVNVALKALAGGFIGYSAAGAEEDGFWLGTDTINADLEDIGEKQGGGGGGDSASVVSLDVAGFANPASFGTWDFDDIWTFSEINGEARPHLKTFVDAAGIISADLVRVQPTIIRINEGETHNLQLFAAGWEPSAGNIDTTTVLEQYKLTLTQHATSKDILILEAEALTPSADFEMNVTFDVNSIGQETRAVRVVLIGTYEEEPQYFEDVLLNAGIDPDSPERDKLRDGANVIRDGKVNPPSLGEISPDKTLALDIWFVKSDDKGNWLYDDSYDGDIITGTIYEGENSLNIGIGSEWDPQGTLTAYETVSDDVESSRATLVFGKTDTSANRAATGARGKALTVGDYFVAVCDEAGNLVLAPMSVEVRDTNNNNEETPPPGGSGGSGVGCDAGFAIFALLPLLPMLVKRRR